MRRSGPPSSRPGRRSSRSRLASRRCATSCSRCSRGDLVPREPAATSVPVKKLLLVDDDAAVREAWSNYLAWHGYEVVEAADGLEALLAVKHERLAAVVLDLALPRLGGLDALKRIHRFDPSLPVVVVTAMPGPEVHRPPITLGALAVLTKPVASPELLIALGGAKQSPERTTERNAR